MPGTLFSRQDIIDFDLVLNDAYNQSYQKALASKVNWFNKVSSYILQSNLKVRFPFPYNTVTTRQQDIGDPPFFAHLEMQEVLLTLKQYQGGAEIHETEFANEMIQRNVLEQVQTLALNTIFDPLFQATNVLREGDTNPDYTVYDGQQLFSTTHLVGINDYAWSNLFSGDLYDPTDVGAVFNAVKSNMQQIPWGPDGVYLPTSGAKFYILAPPLQGIAADKLINNSYYLERDVVGDNPFKGVAEIIIEERLVTAADPGNLDWYVLMVLDGRFPFVHIEQNVPRAKSLQSFIDPRDENVKQNGMYQWSTINYFKVFPAQYFLMAKVTQSS